MHMESDSHLCRIVNGKVTVDRRAPAMVLITAPAGTVSKPAAEVFGSADFAQNEFVATYRGRRAWNVDHFAGAQRWPGVVSSRVVGIALRRCGFGAAQVQQIMRAGRSVVCPSMGRQFA